MEVIQEAGEHHAAGRLEEAAFLYENCLGASPEDPALLYLYGTLCSQIKKFGTAITFLQRSVDLAPTQLPEAWHNLGIAYRGEGHTDAARNAYKTCIEIAPERSDTLAAIAGSYVNTGTPREAIRWADKALSVNAEECHARNHKGLALLELGRYEEGWEYYGARFDIPGMSASKRPFECEKWDGTTRVKKLAVHGEQGLGDEIMYLSCLEDVVATGLVDDVVIECEPRLKQLFNSSFGYKCYGSHSELISENEDADAFIPMGDLPRLFRKRSEDFPGTAYLKSNIVKQEQYRRKLEALGPGPYIGICWHGGTKATHQEVRNPLLEHWQDLVASTTAATFVSLQYGQDGPTQAAEIGIPHWQYAIDDFVDCAALVKALDLVISPCQTAIHLAGALGTPCYCLTPKSYAWRYANDMDWYDSVELFRQSGDQWRSKDFDHIKEKLHVDFGCIQDAESTAA
jgi:Flp pilus assembly protein TadD